MPGGFNVELTVPFGWQVIPAAASPLLHATNPLIYALLEGNEHKHPPHEPVDEHGPLARLETRLNLLLVLVTRLLQAQSALPPVATLNISPERICWQCETPVPVGETLRMQLYPDPALPQPLELCGQVVAGEPGVTTLVIQHPDEAEAMAWQRWLFRLHRRQVAKIRAQ